MATHGQFTSFRKFCKAFPSIRFDGAGQPTDMKSCDDSATLMLEDLDDVEVLQDLCCGVLTEVLHTRNKNLTSNEWALYPLLLSLTDVFLRLGSRAAEIRHIPDEPVRVIGSNTGSPSSVNPGPIEFVFKNGVTNMIIKAKFCIIDLNFGQHIAQICTELICLAQDNNTTDEIFGWLTDTVHWVGLSFKLSEVPDKGSKTPLKDIKGTFKHTKVMQISVEPGNDSGLYYTSTFSTNNQQDGQAPSARLH